MRGEILRLLTHANECKKPIGSEICVYSFFLFKSLISLH